MYPKTHLHLNSKQSGQIVAVLVGVSLAQYAIEQFQLRKKSKAHKFDNVWIKEDPKTGLETLSHPYYARPIGWPAIMRPTSFYFQDVGPQMEQILAIGNPAIFWGSLLAIPAAFVLWRRDRDWRAGYVAVPFAIVRPTSPTAISDIQPIRTVRTSGVVSSWRPVSTVSDCSTGRRRPMAMKRASRTRR